MGEGWSKEVCPARKKLIRSTLIHFCNEILPETGAKYHLPNSRRRSELAKVFFSWDLSKEKKKSREETDRGRGNG